MKHGDIPCLFISAQISQLLPLLRLLSHVVFIQNETGGRVLINYSIHLIVHVALHLEHCFVHV